MDFEGLSIASLMLALIAVWARPAHLWLVPFVVFVASGLASGWITPAALGSGLCFAGIVRFHVRARGARAQAAATTLVVVGAFALGLHLAPGFTTVTRLDGASDLAPSAWSGVRFSADKALVGLFLLLAYRERLCAGAAQWRRAFATTLVPTLLGIALVYLVALALGYVVFDPKSVTPSSAPALLALFARNLFFTVVAEEMIFRQLVQSGLARLFRGERARWLALITASVLFGLVHLPGGWPFALLATLAGAVYGYAFMKSDRIEPAMVAHVALNTGNVLLFSIPASMVPAGT